MSDMASSGDVIIPETQAATEDKKHEHHVHSSSIDATSLITAAQAAHADGSSSSSSNGQTADDSSTSATAAAAPHIPHHALHKPASIVTHTSDPVASASPQLTPDAALPTSSSFNAFATSASSPPQSPNPQQPFSPLPPPSTLPAPPPSRPWSHRLVDYFLVIGRQPPNQQSLVPMRRLSRSNSQTVQPISDLSIQSLKTEADLPDELTRINDFSNTPVNVNAGFMRTPTYLCESRRPKTAATAGGGGSGGGGGLLHPITGIDVLYVDKKEGPKQGFTQLSGNINRGSFKGSVAVAVERDSRKSPIIDIKILSMSSKDPSQKDKDKEKDGTGKDGSNTAADKSAEETCPSDYTMVDKILTSHKGRDYYICYKVAVRRAVEYMAYEAFVLDRYPPTDHYDQPLEAQGVAMLCFPRGMILSGEMAMPSFMTFVITQADGSEMYGAALIFYELITDLTDVPALYPGLTKAANGLLSPPRAKSNDDSTQQVWCPKCLCLLSHHPHYDVFKSFLNQLYRIAVSPSSLPIERYIANFFYDVPVPTPLFPVVRFQMGHEKLTLRQRLTLGLPHQHVSLMPLFKCLSVPSIIAVFQHVLSEGKLVLVSSSYTLLTPVAEAIRALLYPFKWHAKQHTTQHTITYTPPAPRLVCVELNPGEAANIRYTLNADIQPTLEHVRHILRESDPSVYTCTIQRTAPLYTALTVSPCCVCRTYRQNVFIPILPTNLAYTIRAPVPFIVGLHRSFMDEIRVPDEVMQVDLDRNRITQPSQEPDAEKPIQQLPPAIRDQLESYLASFVDVYRPPDEHSNTELDSYTAPLESTDAELATFQELNIRLTFMRVIIRFIGEYRRYCILREEGASGDEQDDMDFDLDRLFDRKAFLASFPPTLVDFARQLTDTQGFSDFVLNRVSFTNRVEELLFFDYCCSLTREEPAGKKDAAGGDLVKPSLGRASTLPGQDGEKRRFGRNRTLTEIVQPTDLYRTGSLTIEKIEEFGALTPSITPFLYTPGHEKPYIAPGPDESDCPPSINYASFPHLDLDRFPASARALLAEQQTYAAYMVIEDKRKSAAKKAAKAAYKLEQRQSHTPGKPTTTSQSAASTPVASPIRQRLQLSGSPRSNGSGGNFAFQQASIEHTTSSLSKIVVALYTILNSLNARAGKSSGDDKKAMAHCAAIYETWFTLFVSEVEKERAKRIEAAEEAKFARTTDAASDPLSVVPDRRQDAFSPISSVVHLLPPVEVPTTLQDLLSIYTELHTMVYKGSVLPTELILQDVSLFCLRAGLTREFQELYRLLSTSVPFPSADFFVTLAKVGVSVLPGNPCSVLYLAEKERESSKQDKPAITYEFPTVLETQCVCSKCGYTLSGEEIMSGWLLSDRLQTLCPLCETATNPSLLVTHGDKPAVKVDFLKTSQLRSTIHTMAALAKQMGRAEVDAVSAAESTTEVQDLGDSGSIDLFAGATGDVVTAHDYIATIKEHAFLFWNVFWFFTTRGLQNEEYGQLPFHFLFGEPANMPTWEQPVYVFSPRPYRPWRVYQEGSAAAAMVDEDDRIPAVSMSTQSSRSVSPSPPFTANGTLLNDRIDLASRTYGNDDADPVSTTSASSSAHASPQINGHRLGETDDLMSTAGSVSLGPAATEADFAAEEEYATAVGEVMSPMSLTGRVNDSLTVSVDGRDAEADPANTSMTSSTSDAGKTSPSSLSSSFDASATTSLPLAVPGSASSRRDVKSWPGIVSIMLAPTASGKQKAVPRAVHEILRARKARKSWSKEQREADAWSVKFGSSMYRQLSLLLQDTTDPLGFAAEYRNAIQSLNALIETHKKAVGALDATIAQMLKTAEKSASSSSSSSSSPASTSAAGTGQTLSGSPPTAPMNIRSPSSNTSSSLSADASSGAPSLARSPSSNTGSLSSLLSPTSATAAATPANLDPEIQREVDSARKKRSQLIATLQEAISLRSEMLPSDQPPVNKYVVAIPAVRRIFAHDTTVKAAVKKVGEAGAAGAAAGVDAHSAYASLVEDVLLDEVPALEDVLSQCSQNPYYTLEGFTKFCAKFVSKEEQAEAADRAAKAAASASSTSAPPSPSSAAPSGSGRLSASKPQLSLAYKYCAFWQTARRWKIGYEKNEKQRNISMAMKKDQQEMIQDVLYDTAKAIYLEYLAPVNAPSTVKKPPSPANPTPATTETTTNTAAAAAAASATATATATAAAVAEAPAVTGSEVQQTGMKPSPSGDVANMIAVAATSAAAATSSPVSTTAAAPVTTAAKVAKKPPAPVLTVAGFTIDGQVWTAMKAALGDVQPTTPRAPSTPTGASAAGPAGPASPSHASSKSTIAATLTRRRVLKTLFDDVLVVALDWLQRSVFDEWVGEVKESEHNIVPSPLQSLTGLTGLHQQQHLALAQQAAAAQAAGGGAGASSSAGKIASAGGRPPFGKSGSSNALTGIKSKPLVGKK